MEKHIRKRQKKEPEVILSLCAHNDDYIIGAGGTLAKYANEGKTCKAIIFSFGEGSHPHLKPEVIIERRIKESLRADKIVGGNGIAYLGIRESHFEEDIQKKDIKEKLKWIISHENPTKIFTHSADDFHSDHKAVCRIVRKLIEEGAINCDVYTFDVWSLVKLRGRSVPKMVVDTTETFDRKIRALRMHTSQKIAIMALLWKIYMKDIIEGFNNGCKTAEIFHKIH